MDACMYETQKQTATCRGMQLKTRQKWCKSTSTSCSYALSHGAHFTKSVGCNGAASLCDRRRKQGWWRSWKRRRSGRRRSCLLLYFQHDKKGRGAAMCERICRWEVRMLFRPVLTRLGEEAKKPLFIVLYQSWLNPSTQQGRNWGPNEIFFKFTFSY